jgi:chromosomal replication initiation ATPase DnaA
MTATKVAPDEAYADRLHDLDADQLHAEGFQVARALSEQSKVQGPLTLKRRMELLHVELARRDGQITRARIVSAVAAELSVPAEQITGRSKVYRAATARQVAMWAIRQRMRLSTVVIGDFFDRDHRTVMHALRRVEGDRELRAIAERAIANEEFS